MPTPKQTRHHYEKITRAYRALSKALNDAHNAKVLVYEDYREESPCYTKYEMEDRILKTTEKALAQAMRDEISEKVGWR